MLIGKIRKRISEGEIKEAIKLLQNGSEGYEDELAIYLMQLSLFEKNNRMGVISIETYHSQLTRISLSILELAKTIHEKGQLNQEIEISFMPNSNIKSYDSIFEEKWAKFFIFAGWKFLVKAKRDKEWISDFLLKGINQTDIEVEVKGIKDINFLKNPSRFIRPEIPNTSLSNCIVLGEQPFLSNNGFYQDDEVIQLGWIFNYDMNQWDNIVLKSNFNISNTKQTVFNLLQKEGDDKNFMHFDNFEEIQKIWIKNS